MLDDLKRTRIVRPEFEPYRPSPIEGNKTLYNVIFSVFITLLVVFNAYIFMSIVTVIQSPLLSPIGKALNLMIMVIGQISASFGIMVLWNFGRRFLPMDAPIGYGGRTWDMSVPTEEFPFLSIVIPTYRESIKVMKRTLLACTDVHYPAEKMEIVVLDDDPRTDELEKVCEAIGARYLKRNHRRGFKAGSINDSLPHLRGDLILFIDSDHLLEKNVVLNSMNAWRDRTIAVQMRIDFVNLHTFLTYTAAFIQMQFFSYYQIARRVTGNAIFAGGTALFDKKLLVENGGMNEDTIADDTDTSYIFVARGYRIEYLNKIGGWGLIPWEPLSLVRQVWRWLTGTTQSFRKRFLTILRGRSPLYSKIDHATNSFFPILGVLGYLIPYFILGLYLLDEPILGADVSVGGVPLITIIYPLIGAVPFLSGLIVLFSEDPNILFTRRPLWKKLLYLFTFYIFIYTVQPLLIIGVLKGLFGVPVEFNRTPKDRLDKEKSWSGRLSHKDRYALYTVFVFLIGVAVFVLTFPLNLADPRGMTLLFLMINCVIPITFAVIWYWKIDSYMEQVGDVSADMVLREEIEGQKP